MKLILPMVLLVSLTAAQDVKTGLSKPTKKPPVAASGFVTESDARQVFTRAEKVLRKLTGSTAKVPPLSLTGTTPISREKTLLQFQRLYEIVKPKVKVTPKPVLVNASVVKVSAATRPTLLKFIKLGAVGNYAPLATGPEDKLTPHQFGDALGFFLARMAQMTHLPSRKWSPPLMDDQ